jgi:hypothetical protein
MKTIGLYLKKEFLSQMSKDEVTVLLQIFRITNALDFWLRLHLLIPEEKNKLFETRNRIELHFALISIYKESIKEFDNNLAKKLLDMSLTDDLKKHISEFTEWLSSWKSDDFLQVVDRIRNHLRYHLKSNIYKDCIKEGTASEDLLFGIADGNRYMDFLLIEPYSCEFSYVAEIVPDIPGENKIDWIKDKAIEETSKFINLLREIIRELVKDNSYMKEFEI